MRPRRGHPSRLVGEMNRMNWCGNVIRLRGAFSPRAGTPRDRDFFLKKNLHLLRATYNRGKDARTHKFGGVWSVVLGVCGGMSSGGPSRCALKIGRVDSDHVTVTRLPLGMIPKFAASCSLDRYCSTMIGFWTSPKLPIFAFSYYRLRFPIPYLQ
jgi:hypothetical protein